MGRYDDGPRDAEGNRLWSTNFPGWLLQAYADEGQAPDWTFPASDGMGYGLVYTTDGGEAFCHKCIRKVYEDGPTRNESAIWMEVYWEGQPMYCGECYAILEAEYGDPNEGKEEPMEVSDVPKTV